MAFLGRCIVIVFALVLAAMAAGVATAIGLLGLDLHTAGPDPVGHVVFWGTAIVASGVTVVVGFLPVFIAVVLAEAFSVRSFVIHAAAGAVILLFSYYSAGFASTYEESIDRAPPRISREAEIAAAVGVVFGMTYWLIAGRNAGRWRERRAPVE